MIEDWLIAVVEAGVEKQVASWVVEKQSIEVGVEEQVEAEAQKQAEAGHQRQTEAYVIEK